MNNHEYLLNEIKKTYSKEHNASSELAYLSDERLAPTLKAMTYELLDKQDADGRISSQAILEVWKAYIAENSEEPTDGWLHHMYNCLKGELFPHLGMPEDADKFSTERESLLLLMYSVFKYERKNLPYDPRIEMPLIGKEDIARSNTRDEYKANLSMYFEHHIYEMMRIALDLGENDILTHSGLVFYLALRIGYQLKSVNTPVDLCLLSAAASTMDLGRFGLRPFESVRMPDLRYYYTDFCLNNHKLPTIAHVAANHSPWDLELENISIEGLILIYAYFRVCKSENGYEILSLADAYEDALSKMTFKDDDMRATYDNAYQKIVDFEGFLMNLGVSVEIPAVPEVECEADLKHKRIDPSILFGEDVVKQLKYNAIDHNTRLMRHFTESKEFEKTIEFARSETHWMHKRTYLNIIDEYSAYMTEPQKDIALEFLYELLSHNASDIRDQAAAIMGKIVGKYREEYKKVIPNDSPLDDPMSVNIKVFKNYMHLILSPEHAYSQQQRGWIISTLDSFVLATLNSCRPSVRYMYFDALEQQYTANQHDEDVIVSLESAACDIPVQMCTPEFITAIRYFTKDVLGNYSKPVDIITLDLMEHFFGDEDGILSKRLRSMLGIRGDEISEAQLTKMMLDDLKLSTAWNYKVATIRVLSAYLRDEAHSAMRLPVAMHLANLAMVSETITVRRYAGEALLEVLKELPVEQRNEVVIELYHGLDIEDFQYLRLLPEYFGKALLLLSPEELDEMVTCLERTIVKGVDKSSSAALITVAKVLAHYDSYEFRDGDDKFTPRWIALVGLLMKGMYNYNEIISQEAFGSLGEFVFNSDILTLENKKLIADQCFKRILIATADDKESNGLDFYNNSTVLNKIYRFISEYEKAHGEFNTPYRDKIAYFPGTFDPFTNGHKTVAKMLNDMGFEVYLAIDEFDWTKKTLPHMLRKKLIQMSVADHEGIFAFPESYPINLRNPKDLVKLQELFAGRELYIVAGYNVVEDSLVYKSEPFEGSVHEMNHIVFAAQRRKFEELEAINYNNISGEIIKVHLRNFNPDASSQNIRDSLNVERDVSDMIDPLAQGYIYSKHFYSREIAHKVAYQEKEIELSDLSPKNTDVLPEFTKLLLDAGYNYGSFRNAMDNPEVHTVYIANGHNGTPVAFAAAHFDGDTAFLDALFVNYDQKIQKLDETILAEVTIGAIAKGARKMVYSPFDPADRTEATIALLKRHGFVEIPHINYSMSDCCSMKDEDIKTDLKCDISEPIVIFRDVEDAIKKPFKSNPRVVSTVNATHNRLLETISEIHPGKLIISLNSSAVYSKITDIITAENVRDDAPEESEMINKGYVRSGFDVTQENPYLAVPFGKALSRVVIPQTVTKALHIEKYFSNDLSTYSIREAVNYPALDDQIAVLKSFDKPVILIDDIFHKGSKYKKLAPILKEKDVDIHKIVVAVLTQDGLDNLNDDNQIIVSPYFIPRITLWINERDCYPFLGGDGIDSKLSRENYSINLIMPYTSMSIVGRDDMDKIQKFSHTCMKNTESILQVLREEYKEVFKRKLTLGRLGAVVSEPKLPLIGVGLNYDDNISPTRYIDNDVKRTERLLKYMK